MKLKTLLEQTIDEINILLEQENLLPLPDLFKHMVLAIFRKGPRNIGWFQASVQIAFEFLMEHGHIARNSRPNRIRLTAKGRKQNARHASEPKAKSVQFDRYWNRYI